MATFSISDVTIKGITCCVPKNIAYNKDITILSSEDISKFIETTGVEERRVAPEDMCSSDLCFEAASDLITELNWNKDDIEILLFVSQTADYILPVTSTILQDRLGLSKNCIAFDIPLGCSGYVYGMSIIAGMMKSTGLKKGLLLAGDVLSHKINKNDKSALPLFGDAASATAFELEESTKPMLFDLGSDGSGYKSIMIPDGAGRNKASTASFEDVLLSEGITRNKSQLGMDGMDVFSFGISEVPKTVNKLLNFYDLDKENIDHFVFHQANMMMNKMITKKLKVPSEKVPYSLKFFGNTSSATIPLTIVTALKNAFIDKDKDLLLCGFGVGLSWGTARVNFQKQTLLRFIEL